MILAAWLAGCAGQAATHPSLEATQRARLAPSSAANRTVALRPGWNSLALESQRVVALSGSPSVLALATFQAGAYRLGPFNANELNAPPGGRQGFWVLATAPTSISYTGEDDGQGNFVDVVSGFNLVSFATATDLPGSLLEGQVKGQNVPLDSVVAPVFVQINADNSYTDVDVSVGGTLRRRAGLLDPREPGRPHRLARFAGRGGAGGQPAPADPEPLLQPSTDGGREAG